MFLRLVIVTVLVLGIAHWIRSPVVESLIPVYRTTLSLLNDQFTVDDLEIDRSETGEKLLLQANLSQPLLLGHKTLYPFGWSGQPAGEFLVSLTVGSVLAYSALVLIVVLVWPARSGKEMLVRLLVAVPAVVLLLLVDVPTTMTAELWNGVFGIAQEATMSRWMIWSRFLMGGGGFVIALLTGIGVVLATSRILDPLWQTVSFRELEDFLGSYPRAFKVNPPWEHPARNRYVTSLLVEGGQAEIIARYRQRRKTLRCQVRKDVLAGRQAPPVVPRVCA